MVRSARRHKTLEITVDAPGDVVVAAPLRTSAARIEAIVRRRAGWIFRHEADDAVHALALRRFESGESLPYLGRSVRMWVREARGRHVKLRFHHWQFDVTAPAHVRPGQRQVILAKAFESWYRERAFAHVQRRTEVLAKRMGVTPAGILVRDQGRRWGSCSPQGVLRFNWRVVMAPPALIDYVVIHELAHLRSRTHGVAYWSIVAAVAPDYRERRRALRVLGPELPL